jgi:hypothetical protein
MVASLPSTELALALYYAPLPARLRDVSSDVLIDLAVVGLGYAGLQFVFRVDEQGQDHARVLRDAARELGVVRLPHNGFPAEVYLHGDNATVALDLDRWARCSGVATRLRLLLGDRRAVAA